MDSKKPWQSKTLVVNGLVGLLLAVSLFVPQAVVVSDYLKSHMEVVGVVWSALNVVLRLISKDKISLGD